MPTPVTCLLDAPPGYMPKARYGLAALLRPIGLDPVWLDGPHDAPDVYYGPTPPARAAIALPYDPDAPGYFASGAPYPPSGLSWFGTGSERMPVLFRDPEGRPDWIAGAFFWLSGWQEVTTRTRDRYGRFPLAASLQYRRGFVTRPVVDEYREHLSGMLAAAGFRIRRRKWGESDWAFCPTHDIDYIRKWRAGILYREMVGYALLNGRRVALAERMRRLGESLADAVRPGDPFRRALVRIQAEEESRKAGATFFFKAGAHGPHDVPYRLGSGFVRRRIRSLQRSGFEIGLHPGFHAHDHSGYLLEERDRLARFAGPLVSVRSHYLRFDPRTTGALQAAAGFRIDSSLGWAEHEGFRRGTCLPFPLFDPPGNAELDLWEMPLAFMEAVLFNRRYLSPEEAIEASVGLLNTCRRFGGACVGLWHNTLWDETDYGGWGLHFLNTLDAALDSGAAVLSLREALAGWV